MRSESDVAIAVYLVLVNLVCVILYAVDKRAARTHRRRTPEATLLLLGVIGGWPGGLIAQRFLHHKTRKRSFQVQFWLTVLVNVGAVIAIIWATAR